jgi:hypothetical protein
VNTEGQITVRQWFRLPKAERQRRAAGFRAADEALQANGDAEQAAGIDWETDEYLRLNARVNDLWPAVPWWIRAPALPHPGSRRGAAGYVLAAAAALAATVLIALALS